MHGFGFYERVLFLNDVAVMGSRMDAFRSLNDGLFG